MVISECCVGNYIEAINGEAKGADRIELCDNLLEGGTTPSYGTIKKTLNALKIPVMVMIRPRGGNFEFSKDEIEIMLSDIESVKSLNGYGVVIGALCGTKIDLETTAALVAVAKPMKVTFHMAFDEIENQYEAIDQLVALGVDRILTKGCSTNALDGKDSIKKLIQYANNRIIIIPGCKVTVENKFTLAEYTGAKEVHGSKIV